MELAGTPGPHVLVDDMESLNIADEDWHHLRRVLRLRTGDAISASDGHGSWCTGVLGDHHVVVTGAVHSVPKPEMVSVGFALVKASKPDLIVQKLTELGVSEIVPFIAARSVVRWDETKQLRAHERHEKIARAATMQSKGSWLPTVLPTSQFADLIDDETRVVRADIGAAKWEASGPEKRRVLVGPEGGWSDEERQQIPSAVSIHSNVLRSETAAITVAVLLARR